MFILNKSWLLFLLFRMILNFMYDVKNVLLFRIFVENKLIYYDK